MVISDDSFFPPNLILILNTHMPYVLEEGEIFHEQENWIFEAITETYIPLLNILEKLSEAHSSNVSIVLSLTPCTIQQMNEGKDRYLKYLHLLKNLAESELERTTGLGKYNRYQKYKLNLSAEELKKLNDTARFYFKRIKDCIRFYENNDIVELIKNLKNIQLWTSCPNHNFLPIYKQQTVEYYIRRGVEDFRKFFKRDPDGFWLPECGFFPGIEKILLNNGIRYTSLNINSIGLYTGREKSGLYQFDDLRILVHDFRVGRYLWKAAKNTIPSHPLYREFFRDLGFDVSPEYLEMFDISASARKSGGVWTGIKYHAVSKEGTNLGDKSVYDISMAKKQTKKDAVKFFQILDNNRELANDHQTFILAFDTEFFGHWWLEGIWWLEEVFNFGYK